MYCYNCGKEVPYTDVFCRHCGTCINPIKKNSNPRENIPPKQVDTDTDLATIGKMIAAYMKKIFNRAKQFVTDTTERSNGSSKYNINRFNKASLIILALLIINIFCLSFGWFKVEHFWGDEHLGTDLYKGKETGAFFADWILRHGISTIFIIFSTLNTYFFSNCVTSINYKL